MERNERLRKMKPPQLNPTSLRLRLGHSGPAATISNAIWEHNNETLPTNPSPSHLLASPASLWLPATALALGLHKSLPFYNHHLDPLITSLATRETIPCGVMVTLGLIPEEDAPPWETKYDPHETTRVFHLDFLAQQRAIGLENSMPPAQAQKAREARVRAEMHAMGGQARARMTQDRERSLKRKREAVGSPGLEIGVVGAACLKWLGELGEVGQWEDICGAVEKVFVGALSEEARARSVCGVLERWRIWSGRGGMTIEDMDMLVGEKEAFCNAACVMALLKEVCMKEESSVALDLNECIQQWNKVRLG